MTSAHESITFTSERFTFMLFRKNIYLVSLLILLLSFQSFSGIYGSSDFVEKERTEKSSERDGAEQETLISDIVVTAIQRVIPPGNSDTGNRYHAAAVTSNNVQFLSPPPRISSDYLPFICVFRL